MTLHNATSSSLTDRNATPRVVHSAGAGGPGRHNIYSDYVTVPAAAAADSIFRILRVPSDCFLANLVLESEAQGAGKVDVGLYYANDSRDIAGGSTHASAVAADAIDQDFFATVVDLASAVQRTSIINESGTNTLAKRQQPLWQAVGLSSNPGGFFDICATVKTTDVTTGTGLLGLEASYLNGA